MARVIRFEVARGMTIMDGFDADKPHFGMTVELDEGDVFEEEVAKAIETVNGVLMLMPESGFTEETYETRREERVSTKVA